MHLKQGIQRSRNSQKRSSAPHSIEPNHAPLYMSGRP